MINKTIEELLYYAEKNLYLNKDNEIWYRNMLMHELDVKEPYEGEIDYDLIDSLSTPEELIDHLRKDKANITEDEINNIMSLLSPLPSEITEHYNKLYLNSLDEASSYFYDILIKNNYIKLEALNNNIVWDYEGDSSKLRIEINLYGDRTKNEVSESYPKCDLCLSNVGFFGSEGKKNRSNLRVIPIDVIDGGWFIRYSKYPYFKEKGNLVNNLHTPLVINTDTFYKMLGFSSLYPSYFIGSNADIKGISGDIPEHEHFEIGRVDMPLFSSRDRYLISSPDYENSKISYLDWYSSTFKIVSKNKNEIAQIATRILNEWRAYNNDSIDIINNTNGEPHQSINPIAIKDNDNYILFIILRNNRIDAKHKDGIFSIPDEYSNIKSSFNLVDSMGNIILNKSLEHELELIEEILSENIFPVQEIIEDNPCLYKHTHFINVLLIKYGRGNTIESARERIRHEIGLECETMIKSTQVFKDNMEGQLALMDFINNLGFEVIKND